MFIECLFITINGFLFYHRLFVKVKFIKTKTKTKKKKTNNKIYCRFESKQILTDFHLIFASYSTSVIHSFPP